MANSVWTKDMLHVGSILCHDGGVGNRLAEPLACQEMKAC